MQMKTSVRLLMWVMALISLPAWSYEESPQTESTEQKTEQRTEQRIEARCAAVRKSTQTQETRPWYGVAVSYAQPALPKDSEGRGYHTLFEEVRWYETSEERLSAYHKCQALKKNFYCTPGTPRVSYGRNSVTAIAYPWHLVVAGGSVIDTYHDGPFSFNATALESCMEDLVDEIYDRL
jgi:hypothetical protein